MSTDNVPSRQTKLEMYSVPKISLLTCFSILTIIVVNAQDDAIVFQERDLSTIHHILEALIKQGASLKDYHQQQRRMKTSILVNESFHFVTVIGDEFIVNSETVDDANKIKVVSNYTPEDENAAKLLLSLLGGGSIKSVTIRKPRKNV